MVYIVIVNWNGWMDTIECLESVFRLKDTAFRVVVCDNASSDDSIYYIKSWAQGNLDVYLAERDSLRALVFPPVPKPIAYSEYNFSTLGSDDYCEGARLVLLHGEKNAGFAAGNNIGLRYALDQSDLQYAWLLNNDTVVDPDSLSALVGRIRAQSTVGMCGSTICYYADPDRVQVRGGGSRNCWFASNRHIGEGTEASLRVDKDTIEGQLDYIIGASMLISRTFLQDVGFMSEEYFLYSEEADWAMRARGRYQLAYVPESIVYHRGGGSTGGKPSALAQFHWTRSWIIFTRHYYPSRLPIVLFSFALRLFRRVVTGDWARAQAICRAILETLLSRKHMTHQGG